MAFICEALMIKMVISIDCFYAILPKETNT